MLRILLADDHSLFREMLTEVLRRKTEAYAVIGEAGNGAEALTLVTSHRPDLLLLDYKMPHVGRLSLFCQDVRRRSPATRILIVSGYVGEKIALEAAVGGARGYILKGASLTDLLSAITTIQAGGVWVDPQLPRHVFHTFLNLGGKATENLGQLTRQELQILSLVSQGLNNKEISRRLYISLKTVKNHLTHLFAKLGVANRRQATLAFLAKGEEGTE
ncbi:MAG TPA: response regulator transcription factor [Candidatus Binatia bacterium]|nr:response regulator transcription factor [Candidatus Binatia bacterium]